MMWSTEQSQKLDSTLFLNCPKVFEESVPLQRATYNLNEFEFEKQMEDLVQTTEEFVDSK